MQQSKLVKLLKLLNKEELRKFDKFLQSPYHNTSNKNLQLFRILHKHQANQYTNSRLDKEKVFKRLYPDAPKYQDSNIRNLMALLTQQIENFLYIECAQKETDLYKKKVIRRIKDEKK